MNEPEVNTASKNQLQETLEANVEQLEELKKTFDLGKA